MGEKKAALIRQELSFKSKIVNQNEKGKEADNLREVVLLGVKAVWMILIILNYLMAGKNFQH